MNDKTTDRLKLFFSTLFILLGGVLGFGLIGILGSLGMFPLYVTRAVLVTGTAGTLAVAALNTGLFGKRSLRYIGITFLCVAAGCAIYIGHGFYRDSLPAVDDRDLLLWQYEPFSEDNKLASLDEPASLEMDTYVLPRLDGATALYPVYAAFVQATYPEEQEYGRYKGLVNCSGTVHAYERLINREVDMIFAAAPSQDQLDQAAKAGIQLHLTPIGREAFVFFVNSKNPVTDLTVEQVQGIYTGQISNWKEVGGRFQRIRPFQRDENSGSQSSLLRLMDGLPLMEPEEEDRIAGMGGIIRQVASYRNYQNAIGFSFRYYSTEMVQNGDIRLLALNGVEPTKETIRDGSYPIASEFYAVTAAPVGLPAPQDTNRHIAALLNWILSQEGQELVERTGYVSLQ